VQISNEGDDEEKVKERNNILKDTKVVQISNEGDDEEKVKERNNILKDTKVVQISNEGDDEEKVKERNNVLIVKKVDHQSAEMEEDITGKSNILKVKKAEEMKVRPDGDENIIWRSSISRDKNVYHCEKQTIVDCCKKERQLRDEMGTGAKCKAKASLILDAEHCLNNISAEVEERIKEKYRKVETMCLSDLEKKFNPIVSSSRLHGVVLYLSNECEKH